MLPLFISVALKTRMYVVTWKCNQLPAGFLASFSFKLHTFRKKVKNAVTIKGIQVGVACK